MAALINITTRRNALRINNNFSTKHQLRKYLWTAARIQEVLNRHERVADAVVKTGEDGAFEAKILPGKVISLYLHELNCFLIRLCLD